MGEGVQLGAHCGEGRAGRARRTWWWRGAVPVGRGSYRAVQTREWGSTRGSRVENVGRPGEKGNGSGPGNSGIFDFFK
jgi:hypothetical protein